MLDIFRSIKCSSALSLTGLENLKKENKMFCVSKSSWVMEKYHPNSCAHNLKKQDLVEFWNAANYYNRTALFFNKYINKNKSNNIENFRKRNSRTAIQKYSSRTMQHRCIVRNEKKTSHAFFVCYKINKLRHILLNN